MVQEHEAVVEHFQVHRCFQEFQEYEAVVECFQVHR